MRTLLQTLLICSTLSFASEQVAAADNRPFIIESGKQQVSLLELYTSEGCSSCPPADRWLGKFGDEPGLWKTVIPLSFHVDYWDYLGWKDQFSASAHSDRQRRHQRDGNINAVYTPGMLVNGREWRGLFEREAFPAQSDRQPGNLRLIIDGNRVGLAFDSDEMLTANLVLLGTDITNRINDGENKGHTLRHEFVVLDHQIIAGQSLWIFDLTDIPSQATAIAGWVTYPDTLVPKQAVGGWLPGPK